ncbi:hypothetical protein D9M73_130400 [compost metagenome]
MDLDLIQTVLAPVDDEEVAEAIHPGHVEMPRRRDLLDPFARRRNMRGAQPEIGVGVVGVDEQSVAMHVDIIFAPHLARRYAERRRQRVGRGQQIDFARHMVAARQHDPLAVAGLADADAEPLIGFLEQFDILRDRRAQPVQPRIVGAPLVVGETVEKAPVIGGPHDFGQHPRNDIGQMLPRDQILDAHLEAFRAIVVDRISQQPPIIADRKGPQPKILFALGQSRFVEDQHVLALVLARRDRAAPPFAILPAGFERSPIDPVAILLRHRAIVFLDAALHLLIQPVDQRLVRFHHAFEIGVLGGEIGKHIRVIDLGIVRVLQPGIRILNRVPVDGEAVRARCGDGGRERFGHPPTLQAWRAPSRAWRGLTYWSVRDGARRTPRPVGARRGAGRLFCSSALGASSVRSSYRNAAARAANVVISRASVAAVSEVSPTIAAFCCTIWSSCATALVISPIASA